jgi:hypothetical protein
MYPGVIFDRFSGSEKKFHASDIDVFKSWVASSVKIPECDLMDIMIVGCFDTPITHSDTNLFNSIVAL